MTTETALVAEAPADRLDVFLAAHGVVPSRAVATRLVREGAVLVNGRPARASRSVNTGDRVSVAIPDPTPAVPLAEDIPLRVVYEDDDLMVIDKAAGMVVHPGAGQAGGTLVNALLALHQDWPTTGGPHRPGIVHRLDKGTSGLMLVARHDASHRRLSADLADRKVSRTYRAIARGSLTGEGVVDGAIGRDPRNRQRMAVVDGGRAALTRFTALEPLDGATYLEVTLGTGRTHQIRVHLAAIGHPLVGDTVYGRRQPAAVIDRPALHAFRLAFRHPITGAAMEFETPPPADFVRALRLLELH
ncbi:MAG TPA: RluA family pseudouridine synthase [Candidatus Solibacter sp.]|nr:RluA family pseudouridine synthase [Candidatus Solibacter sp.]